MITPKDMTKVQKKRQVVFGHGLVFVTCNDGNALKMTNDVNRAPYQLSNHQRPLVALSVPTRKRQHLAVQHWVRSLLPCLQASVHLLVAPLSAWV